MEAFQPLHDEDLTASGEDTVEATAKQAAFQRFWVIQPRSVPAWAWSQSIPFDNTWDTPSEPISSESLSTQSPPWAPQAKEGSKETQGSVVCRPCHRL